MRRPEVAPVRSCLQLSFEAPRGRGRVRGGARAFACTRVLSRGGELHGTGVRCGCERRHMHRHAPQ
eukprot:1428953-Pleurochrysis_carterae.AAC.3